MPAEITATSQVLTANQWKMEIDGKPMATFSRVDGIDRGVGVITRGDGGSGVIYKFTDGRKDYGSLGLTRVVDPGDANDKAIQTFVDDSMASGTKLNGTLTKYHNGAIVHQIVFMGILFPTERHPSHDKESGARYEVTYNCPVDFWEQTYPSAEVS